MLILLFHGLDFLYIADYEIVLVYKERVTWVKRNIIETQRVLIRIFDIIGIAFSAIAADYIAMDLIKNSKTKSGYPVPVSIFIFLLCLVYILTKMLFNNKKRLFKRDFYEEVGVVTKTTLMFVIAIAVLMFMMGSKTNYSRLSILLFLVIQFILSIIMRTIYKKIVITKLKNGKAGAKELLIISTTDRIEKVIKNLKNSNKWEYRFSGIVLLDSSKLNWECCGVPVVANYHNMYEYARLNAVDEIFINVPYQTGASMKEVIENFEMMGITVNVTLQLYDMDIQNQRKFMDNFGGYYVVTYAPEFFDPKMMYIKRMMDIVGAIFGLIITAIVTIFLAPVLLIESPGPLFFSQTRIGKNGRKFKIYKFRSMYMDAEERKKELMEQNEMNGLMFKMKDDPRITKVGKFIRKTSIDELPQFWNILKGDMSLVGTRPPTVDEFEQYENHHKRRVSIVPGLTGLWQASGRSDISDFEEVVNLDLEYIDNWSIWLDIKIILNTILVVFKGEGAK